MERDTTCPKCKDEYDMIDINIYWCSNCGCLCVFSYDENAEPQICYPEKKKRVKVIKTKKK